jgi:hypothetical protein
METAFRMLFHLVVFVFGFGAGYGLREMISRQRRRAAESTFNYPE